MKLNFYIAYPENFTGEELEYPELNYKDAVHNEHSMLHNIMMCELYRRLKVKYPSIEFTPINSRINPPGCCCRKYCTAMPMIENPETGKFIILSLCDTNRWIQKPNGWDDLDNCVQFFAVAGIYLDTITYNNADLFMPYTKCTNTTLYKRGYYDIERLYASNSERKVYDKPFFIGRQCLDFRQYLYEQDNRVDYSPQNVFVGDFMEKLNTSKINIDINGYAEVSNRTFDAMGLGTALVRPKLHIEYHNPLIPDYHYAEVKCEDLSDYKTLADAYIERYEELKKRPDEVQFFSENGRKWWEENCTIDSFVTIFLNLLEIEKLA